MVEFKLQFEIIKFAVLNNLGTVLLFAYVNQEHNSFSGYVLDAVVINEVSTSCNLDNGLY